MKFLKMHDELWQAWRKGTLAEIERNEDYSSSCKYLIRINREVVDGASTLKEAKRLAKQCCLNLDY